MSTARRADDEERAHQPLSGALLRRLWTFTRPYARRRNALFVLTSIRAAQLPALGWTLGHVLSGPVARHDARGTLVGAAAFAALLLFTELTFVWRVRLALELGESLVHDLRRDIFAHLLTMPMSFFHRMPLGRLIGRITSDVDAIRLGVQDSLFIGVVQVGTMLGAAVLMALQDWQLFLVLLALVPVLWVLIRAFHRRLFASHAAAQESFSRVTATLTETVGGIRVIQGFGRQERSQAEFRELIFDHSRYNLAVAQNNAVFAPLLELNGQLFLAVLLIVGGYQALAGHVELGALIYFFFLANLFFNPIPVLATQYNQALGAMAGAVRVFRLLDTARDWEDRTTARDVPTMQGRIEFRDVSFAYEPGRTVLHGVSFVALPGQTVALVGETGGGKSTVLSLVAKLYLPTAGQIFIDEHEIQDLTRRSLRRQMGIVQQANFLFSGTVMDNIRFGRPEASDEEVRAAVDALGVLDMITALPNGFATEVGEKGANLSLGQRQIVCFSRAMLADPRVLLLDEATSAIDTVTEARLQAALRRLLVGRTSFVVAHRLSTVRHADLVLVLAGGRVVERGTFSALVRSGGALAALYRKSTA